MPRSTRPIPALSSAIPISIPDLGDRGKGCISSRFVLSRFRDRFDRESTKARKWPRCRRSLAVAFSGPRTTVNEEGRKPGTDLLRQRSLASVPALFGRSSAENQGQLFISPASPRITDASQGNPRFCVTRTTPRFRPSPRRQPGPQGPRICVICVICVTAISNWMTGNDLRRDANCRPARRLRHKAGVLRHGDRFAPSEPGFNPRRDDSYDELFESSGFSCPARDDD